MNDANLTEARALIARDFELETTDSSNLTEAELLELLAEQVAWHIEHRLEWLLSLMYRLDIDEQKVSRALSPLAEEPANVAIARLVIERQKQRAFTKAHYKQPHTDNWDF